MMNNRRSFWFAAVVAACLPLQLMAQTRADARLITATQVLEELRATPDQGIPGWLMERAYGVAVIPEVIKGALVFGGRHGNGVLTVRDEAGRFSNPVFISLTGGSFGWQIGAQSTDVVLVFATRRSVENFARGKFTLGGSASVAAGPVGRTGEAGAGVSAEIYSYSRSRGLFAGVALDGTAIIYDVGTNRDFYGQPTDTASIVAGKVNTTNEPARRFIAAVAASIPADSAAGASSQTNGGNTAPANRATAGAGAPAGSATSGSATGSGGAKTFPLEDSQPGAEPKSKTP
jgi:lipid-binding SYLF domain-containing protein